MLFRVYMSIYETKKTGWTGFFCFRKTVFLCHRKLFYSIAKNAGFAFFLGAIVVFPSEVFSNLERLRTFFNCKTGYNQGLNR